MKPSKLKAGAGKGRIDLPRQVFPTSDHFSGIRENVYARLLLLEDSQRFALATLDWSVIMEEELLFLRQAIAKSCEMPLANVWVCPTHSSAAPHFPSLQKRQESEEEIRRYDLMCAAMERAVREASEQALKALQTAAFGSGIGTCAIGTNRNVETNLGWWLGSNDAGNVDRSIPVFRFDGLDGEPIAALFVCNLQPAVMERSFLPDNTRQVSGDIAGKACEFLEKELGCTALWCTGAGGDVWPALRANYVVRGRNGVCHTEDLGESGFLLERLTGEHIGQQVLMAVESTKCIPVQTPFRLCHESFSYIGQKDAARQERHAHREYTFQFSGESTTSVEYLVLGNAVLVGIQPHVCTETEKCIRSLSPFASTAVISSCNGGCRDLAEEEAFRKMTFQALNSRYAAGGAEKLLNEIVSRLNELREA